MDFKTLLTLYRERSGLNKTELADKLNVSPEYIMNIEGGRSNRPPPPKSRCEQIAQILNLSTEEKERLIDTAMIERMNPDQLEWYMKQEKKFKSKIFTASDILECLDDEVSVRAFLNAHKDNPKWIKAMKDIIRDHG